MLTPWISLNFVKFQSLFLSGTIVYFNAVFLALHCSYKQPFLALEKVSCNTATHRSQLPCQSHLVPAVTAASHPPPELTMSRGHVISLTVSKDYAFEFVRRISFILVTELMTEFGMSAFHYLLNDGRTDNSVQKMLVVYSKYHHET